MDWDMSAVYVNIRLIICAHHAAVHAVHMF